ncbi:hypothetical protein ACFFJY_02690 [Fictibacillus aquaticus]|uniref:Uncharacterized protein n=1 Tax=Fictibacillus aquaticus TaxID=2021314 RepID=A0A235F8S6_9BACL|nr:hypothetical protein [Fictibacillus aquaticus]OYD57609.1 hypothetical protein CGZ90_13155 [Fictibacillus aquaticus]
MIKILLNLTIFISTISSIIINLSSVTQIDSGYNYLWVQPLFFILIYSFILYPISRRNYYKITVYSFILLAWIRFVLVPLGSGLTGVYNGVPYIFVGSSSIQKSIFLMVYELVIASLFLYILVRNKRGSITELKKLTLKGNKYVYALLILISISLYVIYGRNSNVIQFFVLSANMGDRHGDIDSTFLILIRQIIITGIIYIFVWFVMKCKEKNEITGKSIYVNYAILAAILNVGVIVGERRTVQLYTALITTFILVYVFNNYKKRIISTIAISAMTILFFMSVYKHFSAYAYDSYITAIEGNEMDLEFLTITFQSYFFSIQNVAVAIEMKNHLDINITNMIYDFARSIFGLNVLLKDKMVITSQLFNSYIYGQTVSTGHIISGIGYGYIYLGSLLAPFIVCINILCSIKLEHWFNNTDSIELKYIVGYILVRFTTNLFATTPSLVSLATIMFFTTGLVYYFALTLKKPTYNFKKEILLK